MVVTPVQHISGSSEVTFPELQSGPEHEDSDQDDQHRVEERHEVHFTQQRQFFFFLSSRRSNFPLLSCVSSSFVVLPVPSLERARSFRDTVMRNNGRDKPGRDGEKKRGDGNVHPTLPVATENHDPQEFVLGT